MKSRKLVLEEIIDKQSKAIENLEKKINSIRPKIGKWLAKARPKHIDDAIKKSFSLIEKGREKIEDAQHSNHLLTKELFLISIKEMLEELIFLCIQEQKTNSACKKTIKSKERVLELESRVLYETFRSGMISEENFEHEQKTMDLEYNNILLELEKNDSEKETLAWKKAVAESKLRRHECDIQAFKKDPHYKVDIKPDILQEITRQTSLLVKFSGRYNNHLNNQKEILPTQVENINYRLG